MTYRIEFVLHGLPTPDRNARRHWRRRYEEDRAWKRAVFFAVGRRLPPAPLACARVTYTRHSSVEPDPDNSLESFKPVTDAIRLGRKCDGLPILIDDKPENFVGGRPVVLWEPAPPRRGHITVLIEEEEPTHGQGIAAGNHAA